MKQLNSRKCPQNCGVWEDNHIIFFQENIASKLPKKTSVKTKQSIGSCVETLVLDPQPLADTKAPIHLLNPVLSLICYQCKDDLVDASQ